MLNYYLLFFLLSQPTMKPCRSWPTPLGAFIATNPGALPQEPWCPCSGRALWRRCPLSIYWTRARERARAAAPPGSTPPTATPVSRLLAAISTLLSTTTGEVIQTRQTRILLPRLRLHLQSGQLNPETAHLKTPCSGGRGGSRVRNDGKAHWALTSSCTESDWISGGQPAENSFTVWMNSECVYLLLKGAKRDRNTS